MFGTENRVAKVSDIIENNEEEKDFAAVLQNAIKNSLNDTQNLIDGAERAEIEFALGQSDNTHDLMIAQNKASLAVSYTVAVRDRFIEAYKEIMNMQV
ncbi:MAG: flagellar hook-basal body complex protein FliE [Lachnospiraceae bacterium]|nr:flagellar hook-basal body complex protein FliE [Lachnospiraceae bacterium]